MQTTQKLLRRGLLLEYLTLGWNVVGTCIVMKSGLQANSIALVGFGLDSLVEIGASTVVIWQLTGVNQKREQQGLRLIGTAFFVLATYVLIQSVTTLLAQARPQQSSVGIGWLVATFVVMLALAVGKAHTGRKLDNPVLLTEARVTVVDAYLAGSVLVGLLLNTFFGLWWADPVAGLVIVFYGFKEGWHAWIESVT
ncbi:cation transporter [Aetokthonos hydrillicola Thurmond2011]|jgi:divalent metal cation (Fe/Co/Zn/Cd) transporter|uniref:Cation transporter n=1 Tax=Aetokthonos hydrillicola Thurmond2011 TaxID=2712845 RepID=A0AAP5ICN0_9CYAN|nr:cation transporter [Aetokthonos hydrillicola]MBO3458479.1 cation transporter [Aetokthonos hydrillicola CCALA 1050]MBW4586194.1 cation transporter [Aetokthonos hydrillicola CCALA 1050]MDR9897804.1 cation transporter [Aetokthonos hydrillicola Thurmond2011]